MERHTSRDGQGQAGREREPAHEHPAHCETPTCSSFPRTTPEATVMEASSEKGKKARAMPFLMRPSTVLRPRLSVCLKVTWVPSVPGWRVHSRTGSPATMLPSL